MHAARKGGLFTKQKRFPRKRSVKCNGTDGSFALFMRMQDVAEWNRKTREKGPRRPLPRRIPYASRALAASLIRALKASFSSRVAARVAI